MQLTLTIVSYHRLTPGQEPSRVFDTSGGSIGRAAGNTWILPDPERLISSQHALIDFTGGKFYVTDASTNGLFINNAAQPLGKGNRVELRQGDRLTLGEYELEASLSAPPATKATVSTSSDPFADLYAGSSPVRDPLAALLDSQLEAPPVNVANSRPSVPSIDLGAASDYFTPSQPIIPDDWDELLNLAPATPKPVAQPKSMPIETPVVSAAPTPTPIVEKPIPAVATPPREEMRQPTPVAATPPVVARTSNADLEAFLRGLGLTLDQIPENARNDLLETAGKMLRATIQGMLETLRARASIKSEIRAEQTMIRAAENNPLKFSAGVDDALFNLFSKRLPGFLPPADSVKEAMQDIKNHQVALIAAAETAQRALLDTLKPERFMQNNAGGSLMDKIAPSGKKAGYWDEYTAAYAQLASAAEQGSGMLCAKEFERAYSEHLAAVRTK